MALYGIDRWAVGFFAIDDDGCVTVETRHNDQVIHTPIFELVKGMEQRGHSMPVLLRIENVLDDRISRLNKAFAAAIDEWEYQNVYRGVFPIKVNQQCHVIEEIVQFGRQYHHGLEAGSKAELVIAMSHLQDEDACIICNGYKDSEFIELGLHARQLGLKCFFVIETPSEVTIVIDKAKELGVEPLLGVRVKLSSKVEGHWYEDSGDRSLFGLSTTQLIDVIDELNDANMLHCLKLLHCHIGSQIPNIRNIRTGVEEACRFYQDLIAEGAPLEYLDLGGGLAVDYTGSKTNETHSKNYSIEDYCSTVVRTIVDELDGTELTHPTIITESGRATVAYSSVLLFNILDVSRFEPRSLPETIAADTADEVVALWEVLQEVDADNLQKSLNDAVIYRDDVRELFRMGGITMRNVALAEDIYLAILHRVRSLSQEDEMRALEQAKLDIQLADIYYGNFSLFQSLPDSWAIDQVFPIMPIHRMNEEPKQFGVIADVTCDSDGKIDIFNTKHGEFSRILPLHRFKEHEEYYLGVFLVGAYQETLGDLHNLFGDTHVVSVRIDEHGGFEFVEEIEGDTIEDVLNYVEYSPKDIYEKFRINAERAVKQGKIDIKQRQKMLRAFNASLKGYTYLEKS